MNGFELKQPVFGLWQWVCRDSSTPAITDATYSCDSQSIFACFDDGSVFIFTAAGLKLRCRINPAAYMPHSPRYDMVNIYKEVFMQHCFPFPMGC